MFAWLRNFWADEEGLTTVEYALLLALLVVAAIGIWQGLGTKVQTMVNKSANALEDASST